MADLHFKYANTYTIRTRKKGEEKQQNLRIFCHLETVEAIGITENPMVQHRASNVDEAIHTQINSLFSLFFCITQ